MLFLGLIWFLFLLDMSLASEAGFARFQAYVAHPVVKLSMLVLLWAYLHHLCAGVRQLLLDIDIGVDLPTARMTAFGVFIVTLTLTALIRTRLWRTRPSSGPSPC